VVFAVCSKFSSVGTGNSLLVTSTSVTVFDNDESFIVCGVAYGATLFVLFRRRRHIQSGMLSSVKARTPMIMKSASLTLKVSPKSLTDAVSIFVAFV